jgi:two-component system, OmpR family, sensor histidine kinase CiaH
MFKQARVRLTSFYVIIIMLISIIFSIGIYALSIREFQRGFRKIHMRILPQEQRLPPFQGQNLSSDINDQLIKDLDQVKKQIIIDLVLINSIILIFSAGAGFVLAGKTLKPIKKALLEQKRFIADASHELKTPLTSLKTNIEVNLRNKKLKTTEAGQVLKDSLEDIDSLIKLTNSLLTLSSLQENGQTLVFKQQRLKPIFKKVVYKIKPLISKQTKIKTIIKPENLKIKINLQSFADMLLIFLDNAAKFTKKGVITLKAEEKNKYILITIKDTGMGIGEKHLPFIFNRFYQTDNSRSDKKGFGLGLSLARKIIDLHKGTVKVKSRLKKGTSFIITFPKN